MEHDSYVELQQLVRLRADHIEGAELLGKITKTQMRQIVIATETNGWMSEDWIEFVRDRFDLF